MFSTLRPTRHNVNDDIHKQFQAFGIVIVWNVDSVKLYKLSSILNNPNTLKNSIPSYRDNLQHAQKIKIEFGQPSLELEQDKKKTKTYKVWILKKHFPQEIHVEYLLLEMICAKP
jgi:hypothetical protein